MTIDIFIHPDEVDSWQKEDPIFPEYAAQMAKRAEESDCPILVDPSDLLDGIVPTSNNLTTTSGPGGYQTGLLSSPNLRQLANIFGPLHYIDEIRVHGAYHGRCVGELAMQVVGVLAGHMLWGNWAPWMGALRRKGDDDKAMVLVNDGDIGILPVRYGLVWDDRSQPLELMGPEDDDFGCHNYQLIDEATMVF